MGTNGFVYGAIALSFLITLGFYLFDKKQYKWWEFFVAPAATTVLVISMKLLISSANVSFPEYWGSMVTAVYEEEPWNEWHHQTCSYTTTDSKGNSTTHYYDCSHQDDYGPSWECTTNLNEKFNITEKQYDKLRKQFGSSQHAVNAHKNHSSRSRTVGSNGTKFEGKSVGDVSYVYEVAWKGTMETAQAAASQHRYVNKIKASDLSLFNISVVSKKQADTLGLFQYPALDNNLEYPTIIGTNVSENTFRKFQRLNGKFGPSNQLRLWILVFENKPISIASLQQNYWVKGNMNELVVCVGKKDTTIQWVNAFSWSTNGTLPVQIRDYINNQGSITEQHWNELYDYLDVNLVTYTRRSFEEFDYLTVELKPWQIILIYAFAIACAVGCNFWTSTNEFNDEDGFYSTRRSSKYRY